MEKIKAILAADQLSPKEAESFKGRIQWFESFLFGRTANLAIHRLGKRALARGGRTGYRLDAELKSSLGFLQQRVEHGAYSWRGTTFTFYQEGTTLVFSVSAVRAGRLPSLKGTTMLVSAATVEADAFPRTEQFFCLYSCLYS